jgi:thiol-disulfide isomerase/thioredoxin
MMRTSRFFIFILLLAGISSRATAQSTLSFSTYADLEKQIIADSNSVTVLNFWATWCKPCVEELPDFEKLYADYRPKNVKVILANLDFHSRTETLVVPFIQKNALKSFVVHITDADPNEWIDTSSPEWSGAIPATIIFYKGKKVWFHGEKTDYETLKSIILKYIES